jgi:CRISPR-associated protein Cas2
MEAIASRVQGSVFEAYLTPSELELLVKKSGKIMVMKEDSLRVYVLCAECRARLRAIGLGQVTPPPGVMVV